MKEYEITPQTAPDGSTDYCLCDEEHATRWTVTKGFVTYGWFHSREMAEAFITDAKAMEDRARRFVWGPGDVEHG